MRADEDAIRSTWHPGDELPPTGPVSMTRSLPATHRANLDDGTQAARSHLTGPRRVPWDTPVSQVNETSELMTQICDA